jgi:hypothetical protein
MKIYRFKAIKNPVGDYGACELKRIIRMTTDNILTQYGNTPQAMGERYYFYATDEGRMPTEPAEKHSIKFISYKPKCEPIIETLKRYWPPPIKWEKYFVQWEIVQGDKPALQIYRVVEGKNEPIDAVLFETLITVLRSRYSYLKVLWHPPVGKQ